MLLSASIGRPVHSSARFSNVFGQPQFRGWKMPAAVFRDDGMRAMGRDESVILAIVAFPNAAELLQ